MADSGHGRSISSGFGSPSAPSELSEKRPPTPVGLSSLTISRRSPIIAYAGAMDTPIFEPDFVSTKVYTDCKPMLDSLSDVSAFVFTGPPGSGKTTLTKELCAHLWHDKHGGDENRALFRQLNCASLETLYSDLTLFYNDLAMQQPKLSGDHGKTWNIIQTLYFDLNSSHPIHFKIIILDDVEQIDGVLKIVNHICKILKPEMKQFWKFFVTSQKQKVFERAYSSIGENNFFKIEGFNEDETKELFKYSELDLSTIKKIRDTLGPLPLPLKISMASLKSNQLDDTKESVTNLLRDIEIETDALVRGGRESREDSALIAIKLSIDRLVAELPFPEECMDVIKTITFFDEKNISSELLIACAEMFNSRSEQALMMVRSLTSRLVERCLCTKRVENKVPLFSLHQLVQQSMKLFVKEEEKLSLLQSALIALTRVMPKDGRKHQTRLVGFYAAHGKAIDKAIKSFVPAIDPRRHPFITLLHCQMLISLGYCQLAQRNDSDSGIEQLKQARNKYCMLVSGCDYNSLLPELRSMRDVDPDQQEVDIARKLYDESRNVPDLFNSAPYKDYIAELPLYQRLTKKDTRNMVDYELHLLNDHLTRDQLQELQQRRMVLEAEVMEQVYLGEVLARIYCVWSKVHGRNADDRSTVVECLKMAEAAVGVFEKIYDDHRVYLLSFLITERELLANQLDVAETAEEVKRIIRRFDVLGEIAKIPTKRKAYEAGLVRSDLSNDHYHTLLCKEAIVTGNGCLYSITNDEHYYQTGRNLLSTIEQLAYEQVHPNSALSYSYKKFAGFLSRCKKYGEAVLYILKGMMELRKSILLNNGNGSDSPEIDHPRFRSLYADMKLYYNKFTEERHVRAQGRGDYVHANEEKLLMPDMPEYEYLNTVVATWRSSGMDVSSGQPADSSNRFLYLETILEEEVQELSIGVGVAMATQD